MAEPRRLHTIDSVARPAGCRAQVLDVGSKAIIISTTIPNRKEAGALPEERPTMSAQEAADYLGISKPTLLRLWAQKVLPGYRVTPYRNGPIRLYRDAVEQFDRQRKSQAAI
jgi:excisionase family DNA binding protein